MDDISIIADMINKEDKGRLFMRLKTELENLDPVGKYTSDREGIVCAQQSRNLGRNRRTGAGIFRYMART